MKSEMWFEVWNSFTGSKGGQLSTMKGIRAFDSSYLMSRIWFRSSVAIPRPGLVQVQLVQGHVAKAGLPVPLLFSEVTVAAKPGCFVNCAPEYLSPCR